MEPEVIIAGAAFAASAVAEGAFREAGKQLYWVLRNCLKAKQLDAKKPAFEIEMLYGNDYKNCGIVPGNTNKYLLSRGEYRASKYVSYAFLEATRYHMKICGAAKTEDTDQNNPIMELNKYRNSLILGGPVANEYTKRICGYKEVPITGNPSKTIPIFQSSSPLPYGFYVGDETGWSHWNGIEEKVRRLDEDGIVKNLSKYGIKNRDGNIIVPPVEGNNRLAGDMLMIIRVPNLSSPGGSHTIIGGMHGYSIEAFFSNINIKENMQELIKMVGNTPFFQLLVPVKIESDGSAKIDWNGWANWRPMFTPLRYEEF